MQIFGTGVGSGSALGESPNLKLFTDYGLASDGMEEPHGMLRPAVPGIATLQLDDRRSAPHDIVNLARRPLGRRKIVVVLNVYNLNRTSTRQRYPESNDYAQSLAQQNPSMLVGIPIRPFANLGHNLECHL